MSHLSTAVFITLVLPLAPIATAAPGVWYSKEGANLIGGASFQCTKVTLVSNGADRYLCGSCFCNADTAYVVVQKSATPMTVKFDHTLSSLVVDNVSYDIPASRDHFGCELNDRIKEFRFTCLNGDAGEEKIYFTDEAADYICSEERGTGCSGFGF